MKNLLVCQKVCPIVAEKDLEIASLKKYAKTLEKRLESLVAQRDAAEKRISKVRQAAFGYLDPEVPSRG